MAAIAGDKVGEDAEINLLTEDTLRQIFTKSVVHANWGSSGLPDGNGFTTAILVRSAAFVAKSGTMSSDEIVGLRHERDEPNNEGVANKTIKDIVEQKALNPETSFAVTGYPPKATHGYWFVDGAIGLKTALSKDVWDKLASWAAAE